jgi:hypothetical protein
MIRRVDRRLSLVDKPTSGRPVPYRMESRLISASPRKTLVLTKATNIPHSIPYEFVAAG